MSTADVEEKVAFVEKRSLKRPSSGEAPFEVQEVFFSRTNKSGIIQSGNAVFQRVADFEWDKLLGAPHKIIRHEDMPEAVFWLLWETIKAGNPIGAYVKNKARDGLYYWVFAIVAPTKEGYLSVRIKPTSELLGVIEKEYAILRKVELEDKITPAQSAELLLNRLSEMGFENYQAFAAHCLSHEIVAGDAALRLQEDQAISVHKKMLSVALDLKKDTSILMEAFQGMKSIPTNMRVIASRIEPTGGPISTLAQNYGDVSDEIFSWFEQQISSSDSSFSFPIKNTIENSLFLECASRIQQVASTEFARERRNIKGMDLKKEQSILTELSVLFTNKSHDELKKVGEVAHKIASAVEVLQRHVMGLNTMQIMCKIESARLPQNGNGLIDVIEQLESFEKTVKNQLKSVEAHSKKILVYVNEANLAPEREDRLAS